jgi:hypothetical protein
MGAEFRAFFFILENQNGNAGTEAGCYGVYGRPV